MPAFKYSQITRFILLACLLPNVVIMSARAANYVAPLILTNNQKLTFSTKDTVNIDAGNALFNYGILVENGAEATLLANQFNASGNQLASALYARNGGLINIGKDSVVTHSSALSGISYAIRVENEASVLNINQATVNSSSAALFVSDKATANIINSAFTSNNVENSIEVNNGATLNADGLTVNHSGEIKKGANILVDGARVNLVNTHFLSETLSGIIIKSAPEAHSDLQLNNSTMNNALTGISKISDGDASIVIDNQSIVTGINTAFEFAGKGASDVSVRGKSQITGNIINAETAKTDFTLDDSVLTGAVQNLSSLALNNQSVWDLTGDSVVGNLSVDNSLLNFTPPQQGSWHTLTASTLSGNGALNFNTQLGSDNSPTDVLHILGNASGNFGVLVRNTGGSGALTTGDGIRLVQVDGDDTSSLKLVKKVSAGAYDYYLYKGGSSSSKDWYLRTYLEPVPPPEPVPDPNPAPEPTPEPTPQPTPKPVIAYRTDIVGYIAAPFLNRQYGFNSMGSYHERTGDSVKRAQDGTWGRVGGTHDNYDIGRFSFDSDIRYVQIGKDLYQDATPRGNDARAGVMITLGDQKTSTSDSARSLIGESTDTGDISTDAYGIGGYYTLKTNEGAYVDFVGQYTDYRTDFHSESDARQDGYSVAFSAEGGIPLAITQSWRLEPQTQVIYQYLHMKGFSDGIASVEKTTDSSVQARAGLRLSHLPQIDQPDITPYLNLDAVSTFSDAPAVTIGSTRISPDFTQSTWKAGGGITASLSKSAAFYASANYLRGFDGKQEGYQGNIGINVSFK